MQIRAMEAQPPPIAVIVPGRVYRRDNDATHTPQFHQIEGLAVDEDITLADLKGTLLAFARAIFGERARGPPAPALLPVHRAERRGRRRRASTARAAARWHGDRCNLCKGTGWIEILGAGHGRPERLRLRARARLRPRAVQGFAFGMGVERIAMLKHGVPDLRLFYDNDLRFLEQFG